VSLSANGAVVFRFILCLLKIFTVIDGTWTNTPFDLSLNQTA
jgi:hypothetical protein